MGSTVQCGLLLLRNVKIAALTEAHTYTDNKREKMYKRKQNHRTSNQHHILIIGISSK